MKNEKYHEPIQATIQLDKLEMCCTSIVEDNFNDAIRFYPDEAFKQSHSFGKTTLTQTIDRKKRYKHCYNVSYCGYHIGQIKFCLYGQPHRDDLMWFSISNQALYNGVFLYLLLVFNDLNIKMNNITRLEIALDSYNCNHEQTIRRNYRNKNNQLKIMGRKVKDRKAKLQKVSFWNYGSPDNPFLVRTLYIQNSRLINYPNKKKKDDDEQQFDDDSTNKTGKKKTTIGLAAYNKLEEINDLSPYKTYILDYHKAHNPAYKNIYRLEVRLESEELKRFEKKHKKPIGLSDLFDKQFLYEMFCEYIDRIILIKDSSNKKINLFPVPCLDSYKGKLPLPLPAGLDEIKNKINKQSTNDIIINYEILKRKEYNYMIYNSKETIYNKIPNNDLNDLIHEIKKKFIRRNQAKDKQSFIWQQQPQLRATTITPT